MAIAGSTIGLIRTFFNRSRSFPQPEVMQSLMGPSLYPSYGGTAAGGMGPFATNNSEMQNAMQINNDLLSRYSDYEDMSYYPEIFTALNIYSDEATQEHPLKGKCFWIDAEDQTITDILEYTFHKQLGIDDLIWGITRTLCKYGNVFYELIVQDGMGIIKLIKHKVPYMRRIQDEQGNCFGFMRDPSMAFKIDTQEFLKRLYQGESSTFQHPQHQQDNIKVYEPWEIAHFRLETDENELYGIGIAEGGRWAWKRLQQMEDAMVVFKLCLRGDSRVWTPSGIKLIKDVQEGEEVYSFDQSSLALKKTKVVYKKHNGQDKIYHVHSMHRDLYANATHPVLVEEIINNGSGTPRTRILKYVEVKDLIPGVHRFCTPYKESGEEISLKFPSVRYKSIIVPEYHGRFDVSQLGRRLNEIGLTYPYARRFFAGEGEVVSHTAKKVIEALDHDPSVVLAEREDWGGVQSPDLIPKVVDEDFAQWFGFMVGDGSVSIFEAGDGFTHSRVSFALSDDQESNEKYRKLFEKIVGEVRLDISEGKLGSYVVSSKEFCDFMLLNGYIPGAHNKRIPEWVFRASLKVRLAFLNGLLDADSNRVPGKISKIRKRVSYERAKLEMCNRELIEDVRDLCMQCGIHVTRVCTRLREGGRIIKGAKKPLEDRISHAIDIMFKPMSHSEKIFGVTEVVQDDIWDIGVEAEEHNFVANGVVVHNTRSPQRYAFYVDVGDVPPNEGRKILNQVKQDFKKQKLVDPVSGKMNLRYNPLSSDEDFFLAKRKGERSTEIEVLSGLDGQSVDDTQYFRDKLISALAVPKAYLGYDETIGRANLGQMDIRMAKTVLRIQKAVKNGLKQIGDIDLASRNIDPQSVDYSIGMTVPSGALEVAHIEVQKLKCDLAASYQGLAFSEYYIWSQIMGLSDDEIEEIQDQRAAEITMPGKQADTGGMPPMGGGSPMGEIPGGEGGTPEGETPPEEAGAPPVPPLTTAGVQTASKYRRIKPSSQLQESKGYDNLLNEIRSKDAHLARRIQEVRSLVQEMRQFLARPQKTQKTKHG